MAFLESFLIYFVISVALQSIVVWLAAGFMKIRGNSLGKAFSLILLEMIAAIGFGFLLPFGGLIGLAIALLATLWLITIVYGIEMAEAFWFWIAIVLTSFGINLALRMILGLAL